MSGFLGTGDPVVPNPGTPAFPNLLASGVSNDPAFQPFQLFAGESDIVTSQGTAGGSNIVQFAVLARSGSTVVAWDGSTGTPFAIAAQAIGAGTMGPYYVGGVFNHQALVWPSGVTTLDARKKAFDGTNITISALL